MTPKDIVRFIALNVAVLIVIGLLSLAIGRRLDEFDYLHAMIWAAVGTIVAAIRESRA